ncbi:hypothetical protein F5888DRAFT_1707271 [Russula emetica]|nr:hypothetical protein F5888DRAFT_1707271 [Russula emetica]
MRSLWDHVDDSVRITSRSICALVARQVIRKQRLKGAVLSWLREVTGESSNSILDANITVLDQMNFKSFVNGALPPSYLPHRDLSTEDATSFNETLAILLGVRTDDHDYFNTPDGQTRLSEEVGRIQRYDPQGGFEVFDKLRLVFPSLPPVTSAHAEVSPSRAYLIIPPSPVLPPPREVPTPRAPPSPRPVPPPIIRPSHRAHRHRAPM